MKLTGAALGVLSSGAALVQGVDIASGLSVLLPDLSQGNLAGLEDQLTKMVSNSGSTNAGLFDDLSRMINETMSPAILQAHADGQDTLDGLTEAFGHCTSAHQSDDSDSKVKDPTVLAKLEEHKKCRDNQNNAFVEAGKCGTTLNGFNTAKTAACNAVPGSDGVVPPVYSDDNHVGCQPIPNSYDTWVASLEHHLLGLKGQLDEAKAGCGNATKLADDKGPECTAKSASVTSNKTACDALQVQADALACSAEASQSTACTAYVGCYGAAVNTLVEQNATIAAQQLNWTVQWRGLKRIQCLLAQESNGATHDGINACREATIDTSHLDLDYPVVPPFEECEATTEGPKPCSDDYTSAYGDLPLNAPAAPCTSCPPPKIQCAEGVNVVIRGSNTDTPEVKFLELNIGQATQVRFQKMDWSKSYNDQMWREWILEPGFVEGRGQRTFIKHRVKGYYLESMAPDDIAAQQGMAVWGASNLGDRGEKKEWRIIAGSRANHVYLMNYKGQYLGMGMTGVYSGLLSAEEPVGGPEGLGEAFLWFVSYVPGEHQLADSAACHPVIDNPVTPGGSDCVWSLHAGQASTLVNKIDTKYDLDGAKEACMKHDGCKAVTCEKNNRCTMRSKDSVHLTKFEVTYLPVVGKCNQNLNLGEYEKIPDACVTGHNIRPLFGVPHIDICKNICDGDPSCLGFEWKIKTKECRPQNGDDPKGCNSKKVYDLYLKKKMPTVPSVTGAGYDCNQDGTNECGVWSDAGAKCSNSANCSYDYKFGDMHLGQTCRCID